jgi:hypothetical protein
LVLMCAARAAAVFKGFGGRGSWRMKHGEVVFVFKVQTNIRTLPPSPFFHPYPFSLIPYPRNNPLTPAPRPPLPTTHTHTHTHTHAHHPSPPPSFKKIAFATPQIFKQIGSDGKGFPPGKSTRATGVLKNIVTEMRQLRTAAADAEYNLSDKQAYTQLQKASKKRLKAMLAKLKDIRTASTRVELIGSEEGVKAVTNREVASAAVKIQNQNKNITADILNTVGETKMVATANLEALESQNEKIKAIGAKVHNLRSDVKRAGKLLTQFRQRMMTDKLIVCFIFLVVAGIAFCIIYAAVNPGDADDLYIPAAATPPTVDDLKKDFNVDGR